MTIEQIGLLASGLVNCVALYGAFRKARTTADRDDTQALADRAEVDAVIEETAIERWREYAAEQEAARQRSEARFDGVIEQMRSELAASREEGGKCRERSARQEVTIDNLKDDLKKQEGTIEELRAELKRQQNMLKRAGLKPGSGERNPLE